jgi:3-methyladenine DNA glycosylase AlkC
MAEALKKFFDKRVVMAIAADIKSVHPAFAAEAFERYCLSGLDTRELTARAWHIAEGMHRGLPQPYKKAVGILLKSLPVVEDSAPPASGGMASFKFLPHVFYVARYGIDHLGESMRAQYELTKRFTAEFSIRVFIDRYPEAYGYLETWARDPNVHVRRLVSEGSRPRLPWAPRLRHYQKDPSPVLKLLEQLKDDPELYVRRSVANNLNDIGKDHPEMLLAVARRWWKGASANRKWVIRRALRSLVKEGNPQALTLLGFGSKPMIRVRSVKIPSHIQLGTVLTFTVDLESALKSTQNLMVDCVVHFVKARGTARKVFKLRTIQLEGLGRITLRGRVSFAELTTRKPYPGLHRIDLAVNGKVIPLGNVTVTSLSE